MHKWNKIIIFIFFIFLLTSCENKKNDNNVETKTMSLKGEYLNIEIVKDSVSRTKGLSNRESLCETCGMLFVFEDPGKYIFWMNQMNFPIDIIYIKDYKITEVFQNVEILTNGATTTVYPQKDADMVLELNSGWSKAHNLEPGDALTF